MWRISSAVQTEAPDSVPGCSGCQAVRRGNSASLSQQDWGYKSCSAPPPPTWMREQSRRLHSHEFIYSMGVCSNMQTLVGRFNQTQSVGLDLSRNSVFALIKFWHQILNGKHAWQHHWETKRTTHSWPFEGRKVVLSKLIRNMTTLLWEEVSFCQKKPDELSAGAAGLWLRNRLDCKHSSVSHSQLKI